MSLDRFRLSYGNGQVSGCWPTISWAEKALANQLAWDRDHNTPNPEMCIQKLEAFVGWISLNKERAES